MHWHIISETFFQSPRCTWKVPEIYFIRDGDGSLLFYKKNIRFVLVGAGKKIYFEDKEQISSCIIFIKVMRKDVFCLCVFFS